MARGFKGFNRKSEGFLPWERDFAYTGGMQSIVIPHTALYKLEVWGASGGGFGYNRNSKGGGANGGYSIGYVKLHKGDTIYVCVGGAGAKGGAEWNSPDISEYTVAGGYNGGGNAHWAGGGYERPMAGTVGGWGGGGGATHMATVTGTIRSIGKTEFVDNGKGLIVAGGGGGFYSNIPDGHWNGAQGGAGGGLKGGSGGRYTSAKAGDNPYYSSGGTQTSGNAFGYGGDGAGGGLYGGGKANGISSWDSIDGVTGAGCAGGGGSGYIGGVPEITYHGNVYLPTMYTASNSGNGKAKITLIK